MPDEHARLSPSAAERWLSCPASIRMADKVGEQKESPYAAEGTAAHELGEIEAAHRFGLLQTGPYLQRLASWRSRAEEAGYDIAEMEMHVAAYVALLEERVALYPHSRILLEQRLPTGLPQSFGTSDAVIFSPTHIEIVDLKYGAGVVVSAKGNPQLRLYALGALDTYGDVIGETELVRMTVFQPRAGAGIPSTDEMDPLHLRNWRESILPIAQEALGPDAHFGPSEKACRWCPAAGLCRARMEKAIEEDFGTLPDDDLLTPEEVAELLLKAPEIKLWLAALEETALKMAYSDGVPLPGWKVIRSGGKRVITDSEAAINRLLALGFTPEQVSTTKVVGIGELEKLLKRQNADQAGGQRKLEDVLGELLTKTEGRPSLAPEDDKRPAIDRNIDAAEEFNDGGGEA